MDDVMLESEVIDLLGRERFKRLCAGDWLTSYARHYVEFRLREDEALRPEEGRRPPVVTKGYRRPAPPAADDYRGLWTQAAAEVLLGRQAFAKAVRGRSLRPVAVRGGVQLFRKADVRRHLPRPLLSEVAREWAEVKRRFREVFGVRANAINTWVVLR
jgi:hypothetical protein